MTAPSLDVSAAALEVDRRRLLAMLTERSYAKKKIVLSSGRESDFYIDCKKTVLTAEWGPAVAKNPFLQFTVKGAKAGDKIGVTWKDNKGDTRTDEAVVS